MCENGVPPEVIVALFEIDLRTVFRLFERKIIRSVSRWPLLADKDEILAELVIKNSSCSRHETRDMLRVGMNTVTDWKKLGILQPVRMLGRPRNKLTSIQVLLNLPQSRPANRKFLFGEENPEDLKRVVNQEFEKLEPKVLATAREKAEEDLTRELEKSRKLQGKRFKTLQRKARAKKVATAEKETENDLARELKKSQKLEVKRLKALEREARAKETVARVKKPKPATKPKAVKPKVTATPRVHVEKKLRPAYASTIYEPESGIEKDGLVREGWRQWKMHQD